MQVLAALRIKEVTEVVLGFSEMATIRIGEVMDQPRNARIQAFKNDKARKQQKAQGGTKQKEHEAKRAAILEAMRKASAKAHRELAPTIEVRSTLVAARRYPTLSRRVPTAGSVSRRGRRERGQTLRPKGGAAAARDVAS